MILEILFVVTAVICIYNIVIMLGAILGNGFSPPFSGTPLSASHIIQAYPSIGFQVHFWATHFGVI